MKVGVGVVVGVSLGVSVLTSVKVKVGVAVQEGEGVEVGVFDWAHKAGAARRNSSSTQYINLNVLAPKLDRLFVSVIA